jgi:antitoxin component YwqK of YwqJK toxin-antitoxin module
MRKVFFIYCWLFALLPVFAQRPDSVQVNGQWYFIYPIKMELEPSDSYLTVTGLTKTEFEQYRHWTQANDPRLNLEKDSLINALRKSIIDDKILTTAEYDDETADYQDKVTHSHHSLFKLSRKLGIRRKLRHAQRGYRDHKSFIVRRNVNKRDLRRALRKSPVLQYRQRYFTDYSLPPSEKNLPDGNYMMYYEDFFSVDDWQKWEVNPQRVAAVFSLSDNLLNGDYKVFTYEGCQVVSGNYANGLRQDAWMMKVPYQYLERKEGWFFNRKYRLDFVKTDSLSYHFEADLLDGECGYFWCYNDKPIEKSWTGHFKNGFPYGEWVHEEFGDLIFKGNIAVANDAISQLYAAKWIEAPIPASDSIYDFTQIDYLQDYRMVLGVEHGNCIENSGWASVNKLKDYPLEYFVQSAFSPDTEVPYYRFGTHCELYKEERPDIYVARFYRNEDLKLIVGSRYFNNGVLFDTCGLDAQGQLIYRQFDNTGKLYLTAWLNEKGERIRSVYSTPEKKQFIDGYEVKRGFYGGTFYWEGDSVVANKRVFQLTWNEDKQLFYENYYDSEQQQLVEKRYDTNEELMTLGIIPFPNDSMTKFAAEYKPNEKRFKNYYKLCNRLLSIDSFQKQTVWGHLTFVQENRNGVSNVKLYVNGEPYSGDLEIRVKSKGYDRYKIKRNKLVLELHQQTYSRRRGLRIPRWIKSYAPDEVYTGIQESIPLLFQLKIYGPDTYSKGNYGVSDFLSGKGLMQNGIPQGKWLFYKRQLNAEMTYTGDQSSGFLYDNKIQQADLKWESEEYLTDPLKETYMPACKKSVSYVFRKTPIANRMKEGTCVMYNHIGDTVGLTVYKNGKLHGNQWYSFSQQYSGSGDTKRYLIGKFENGEATGTIVAINVEYETATGGGKLVTDTLAVAAYANGKRNGAARYQLKNLKYDMTFANDLPEGGLTIKNYKNETIERYFFNGGRVNKMQYFKENTLSYEYLIPEKDSLQLELEKIYELTDVLFDDHGMYEWKYASARKIDRHDTPEKSVFTKFYPNGSVARTGELISEKKTGRWAYANEDQTTRYTIDYKDSIYVQNSDTFAIIGVQTNLDANGKEVSKQLLLEEKDFYKCTSDEYYSIREYLVPESTVASEEVLYYYDNGALMSKGKLLNGLPDGLWQFYNQQGGLTRTGIYKNGKKIGRWLEGDLTTKAYLGDICLDESNPDLEVIISQLERGKKIAVTIYRDGKPVSKQTFESVN